MKLSHLIAALVLCLAAAAAARGETRTILAGHVLDIESGRWQRAQAIEVVDGRVRGIRPIDDAAVSDENAIDLRDHYVVPGLIDAHVHLFSSATEHGYRRLGSSLPEKTLRGVTNAEKTLAAGFTTVRMVGAPGFADVALANAIERGELEGPRMKVAGPSIGITGGHCSDNNLLPFEDNAIGDGVADGPWDMRRLVRRNVKYGATVIKACSTGGVLSRGTEVGAPQGSLEELTALVTEAHMQGLRVAVHAHGASGIRNAILAGADSIEHASFIDDEGIRLAKENDTVLVMDIYTTEYILEAGESAGILEESLEKERRVGRTQRENFRKAHEAGVRMAFGSDAGVYPHGRNARQLERMVRFGMEPLEALQAATVNAAVLLDMDADVGSIEAGKFADLVAVRQNPLDDITILETPAAVIKGGRVVAARR